MISEEDVVKIGKLARLRLSPDEVALYRRQLGNILESMEELSRLDISGVEPTSSVLGLADVTREDETRPFPGAEKLLANAPAREGPYYKVRKVIE